MNMKFLVFFSAAFIFLSCSAEHDSFSSGSGSGVFTKNTSPDPLIVADAKNVLENSCYGCHNTTNGTNSRFLPDDGSGGIDMSLLADNTTYVMIGVPIGSSLLQYFNSMPIGAALGSSSLEGDAVSDWIEEMGVLVEE